MKHTAALALMLVALFALSGCSTDAPRTDAFSLSKQGFTVVTAQDTHGGFHGDGTSISVFDCAPHTQAALRIIEGWNALPLPETLQLLLYGGEKDGVSYTFYLAEEASMPTIEQGFYRFIDRHAEAQDAADASALLERSSLNFSLAIYDSAVGRFYVLEVDT